MSTQNIYFHKEMSTQNIYFYKEMSTQNICFYTVDWLCWGLTTRQPLRVILCRLPEKGRNEIEERE